MHKLCNDQKTHDYWKKKQWPCPLCAAMQNHIDEEQKQKQLATLLAQAIKQISD